MTIREAVGVDDETRELTINDLLECRRNLDGSFIVRVVTTEVGALNVEP